MQAVREIRNITTDTITIHVPVEMRHHRVEIILLTLDEGVHQHRTWPTDFIAHFAGSLPDFPQRLPEGDYENRKPL